MTGKADRMARIAHIRSLQKRQALAQEAAAVREAGQIRQMAARIESLRQVYTPVIDKTASFSLKSVVHQYERLGKALAATQDRQARADAVRDAARADTLEAHKRQRAADELAARAEAAEALEDDRRRERNAVPRRRPRD